MLHELCLITALLLSAVGLVLALNRQAGDVLPPYALLGGLLVASLAGYGLLPPTPRAIIERRHPPLVGREAGLRLGLWAQTWLPARAPAVPSLTWLQRTQGGRVVRQRPIVVFREPARATFRRQGVQRYFASRFGWRDALQTPFVPQALIVHSTEGQDEAHAFGIFDRNTREQYLGGVWTHFSVTPEGQIVQYGPLNRISKGQAGLDDSSIGIEIVGNASLWPEGVQTVRGSVIARWQSGDTRQLRAVADLLQTLRNHYRIPRQRIYAHEDLGHVRDLRVTFPDMHWLRRQIRDRVYLGVEPTLDRDFQPERLYDFLEPYDRYDPGRDVMAVLYGLVPLP